MRILYLGADTGTSLHRAAALDRLGHRVRVLDPNQFVPAGRAVAKMHWETGGVLCRKQVTAEVMKRLGDDRYDLTWVDNGRYVGPELVAELRRRFGPVLNLNVDDPYGRRDRGSWALYRRTVPAYDLIVVVREENVAEASALGARKVLRIFRSADEVAHAPRELTEADHAEWDSQVLFIGTWMEGRGAFMAELVRAGLPLTLRGDRWQRAREWPLLQSTWAGPGTKTNDEYAKAIQCSKVCLGLLSKGNRDLHTQRSFEVPYLGGLFCAERNAEHQSLYCEGEEAVFWSDAAECVKVCRALLADELRRQRIARRGRERCLENGSLNEQVMARVLAEVAP